MVECGKPTFARGFCSAHYERFKRHGDPLGGRTRNGAGAEFIQAAIESATDEHIVWPYPLTAMGYGVATVNGKLVYAHIAVAEAVYGPGPSGTAVAHAPVICHIPACINPRHLRWATYAENQADRIIDGTSNRGERNGLAKLTAQAVLEIRASTDSADELAERYGVKRRTIHDVIQRRSWKHL